MCIQMSADTVIMELKERPACQFFAFIASICTTQSFSDPWNESERQVILCHKTGVGRRFKGNMGCDGPIYGRATLR